MGYLDPLGSVILKLWHPRSPIRLSSCTVDSVAIERSLDEAVAEPQKVREIAAFWAFWSMVLGHDVA